MDIEKNTEKVGRKTAAHKKENSTSKLQKKASTKQGSYPAYLLNT